MTRRGCTAKQESLVLVFIDTTRPIQCKDTNVRHNPQAQRLSSGTTKSLYLEPLLRFVVAGRVALQTSGKDSGDSYGWRNAQGNGGTQIAGWFYDGKS